MNAKHLTRARVIVDRIAKIDIALGVSLASAGGRIAGSSGDWVALPEALVPKVERLWKDSLRAERASLIRECHQIGLAGVE